MKKVLMISRYYHPHIGGVEKHLKNVAELLVNRQHEINVITWRYDQNLPYAETIDKVRIYRVDFPQIRFIGLVVLWVNLLKQWRLVAQSDLIHVHDVFIWYLPFRLIFPLKRVFSTFHGWEGVIPIPITSIFQKKLAACLSEGTISIGTYIEKIYSLKCDLVSYGGVRPKSNFDKKQDKMLVYVGRLEADNGLGVIFKAMKLLRGYRIIFCGDGSLRKIAQKYGKVLGFVDPAPYVSKSSICFCGGYLSVLEAFVNKSYAVVVYESKVRFNYLSSTPFARFLFACNTPQQLRDRIRNFEKRKDNNILNYAYLFAQTQNWLKVTELYLKLWSH